MKKKLFVATSYYPKYLKNFYSQRLNSNSSYDAEYNNLMEDNFSWGDCWERYLKNEFFVQQVVINNEVLQKKWATENRVVFDDNNWCLDILKKQVQTFKPDIFFSHDTDIVKSDFREYIKNKLNVKKVLVWDGVGTGVSDHSRVNGGDIILSCNRLVVEKYKYQGKKSILFSFGFNPEIINKISTVPQYDVSFVFVCF